MRWIAGYRAGKEAQQMKFADRLISNLLLCMITASLLLHTGCAGYTGKAGTGPAETTIPAVPAGLAAAAGNAQVALHWTASSGATGYYVERSNASGGPYTQLSVQAAANYMDTGLTNGSKYFYVVSAYNSAGQSANSADVSATPTLSAPPVPTGLSATAGNGVVSLTWTGSSGATSYYVKRSTSSGAETQIAAPTSTSYTDTAVTNGTKYFYVVAAADSGGDSANSSQVSATPTLSAPPVPTGLSATAGNAQVSLAWTASANATSYQVKRSTSSGAETQISAPTSTSYTDTAVTNGTKYFYVVAAVDSGGESANSSQVSATPTAPETAPATPTGLQATAGNAQVSLSWNASAGAASYDVKRSTTSGGPYSTAVASPTATSYTDTSVTNGTIYYYVISAANSIGQSANSTQASATPAAPVANVTITINPAQTKPISPWIYGINAYSEVTGTPPGLTFDRAGASRWTAYNWETNASNGGSDYFYENDDNLSSSTVPDEAVRSFIARDQSNGMATLMTVPLQGLVAADENGPVSLVNAPDMSRFKVLVDQKSTVSSVPFTLNPPINDAYVFADESVWALDQKFPGMGIFGANPALPTFVCLDNEPELWNQIHPEVQGPNPITPAAFIAKTITMTQTLKKQFPDMVIFGPVNYSFLGMWYWRGEISPTPSGANWFTDQYLTALSSASATFGKPLVDVYDFHWYAQEYDVNGVQSIDMTGTTLTDAQVQLIVQSPRNLWDPTFTDYTNSKPWIFQRLGHTPINILGRLQSKINAEFPGMKMAITEYENGGYNHIAGTIAQADNLGVFGAQGVFAATFWPPVGTYSYAMAGFRVFRDFDGAGANFGDTSLLATSSSVQDVVVYASSDSKTPGRYVFVAINRSTSSQVTAINGQSLSGTARLYQITAASAQGQSTVEPVSIGTMPVSGSSFTITLPALSVTTIEVN
jgi:fibronectin type 3 domain-containing protein